MEYNLKAQPIHTLKEILSTTAQQPVDLDFTLPDYCADVERILKCSVSVKIFSHNISAGQLRIDGTSLVRIIYTDSGRKQLRSCEQNVPFSTSINVPAELSDVVLRISAKAEYLNCRALTPRRLVVHGALALCIRILSKESKCLYINEDCEDLETSETSLQVCKLSLLSQDRFTLNETVPISTKKSVETIVRSELIPKVNDYKISSGQLTINGELILRMLYICDVKTSELDRFVTSIPFSQTLRIPDFSDEITKVDVELSSFDVTLKSEIMQEEPCLYVEANLTATVEGFEREEVSYICDAYSTLYDTDLTSQKLSVITDVKPVDFIASTKADIEMGDCSVQKIIDIFADTVKTSCDIKDEMLSVNIRADVTILAISSDDEIVCIERQVEFSHEHKLESSYSSVDSIAAQIASLSFRLGDSNDMQLRIEASVSGLLINTEHILCTTGVTVLKSFDLSGSSPLKIYYADEGERVWDIAKHFRTSLKTLREENSLECDVLSSPSMLMIVTS